MNWDVIVVGGGGSGLATAVSAAEHGLWVLLLEKQPSLGGTTGMAVGSFTANRTEHQRRAGIQDAAEDHVLDAGLFAPAAIEARNNRELRRYFLDHAADTLHWLTRMGLSFHGPSPEPPNRVSRMHNVVPGARAYITTLQARFEKLGGLILCNAGVERLVCEDGRVAGVIVEKSGRPQEFRAKRGVVLAAGDYANSPELIKNFKGDQFSEIEGINPFATGDGHRLAQQAGARLTNMDVTYGPELRFVPPPRPSFLQLLPTGGVAMRLLGRLTAYAPRFLVNAVIRRLLVTWQHPENALFDDGAILVNQNGRRFCDERDSPGREIAIASQPGKCCYIVLDQRLIQRYSVWPHFISTAPQIAYAYVEDYLRLRADIAVRARTLEALAMRRGINASALQATVDSLNMQRRESNIATLEGGDWVLLGPAKAYFTTTEGGASINERFQVLNDQGQPIEGLYAVGQNGLGGQILWGHGLHIAWAMTSGRLCGSVLAGLADS